METSITDLQEIAARIDLRNLYAPEDDWKTMVPGEITPVIRNAPNRGLFTVNNVTEFNEQVLKCDRIVFQDGGALILNAIDGLRFDWVAVVAREWLFTAPNSTSVILRSPSLVGTPGYHGADRGPGGNGDNWGENGGDGGRGGDGTEGGPGNPLSRLYLIGERVLTSPAAPTPIRSVNLQIHLAGARGGSGGDGGRGGDGGAGHQGRPGRNNDQWPSCATAVGDGGNGGRGGIGGNGGRGGPGGGGGRMTIAGIPATFISVFAASYIINKGGDSGFGGNRGAAGSGGRRGIGGNETMWCKGGRPGYNGPDGSTGEPGGHNDSGTVGNTDLSDLPNLNGFY
jgi:hypothetical protein